MVDNREKELFIDALSLTLHVPRHVIEQTLKAMEDMNIRVLPPEEICRICKPAILKKNEYATDICLSVMELKFIDNLLDRNYKDAKTLCRCIKEIWDEAVKPEYDIDAFTKGSLTSQNNMCTFALRKVGSPI
jgi:hypothetical protein